MASTPVLFELFLCFFLRLNEISLGISEVEPVCLSRFDHDYKVLQKLADLEQKQKDLEQRLATKTGDCSTQQCDNGWIRYGGSCYLFLNHITMSWSQGVQHCESFHKGHLAVMETFAEQSFLTSHAKNMAKSGTYPFYWIGATDSNLEGNWEWYPSGNLVGDGGARWYPGQPADSTSQNCGCLWGSSDFTFHDFACSKPGYVICEKRLTS